MAVRVIPLCAAMEMNYSIVLFEKNQKDLFFLLAQKKELKKTSTYPKPFPIWKGLDQVPTMRHFTLR